MDAHNADAREYHLLSDSTSGAVTSVPQTMDVHGYITETLVGTGRGFGDNKWVMQMDCCVCHATIIDRYVLRMNVDEYYHARCLVCCVCDDTLTERCYTRDGKVYCPGDFHRYADPFCSSVSFSKYAQLLIRGYSNLENPCVYSKFGTGCAGCGESIATATLIRRAHNLVYHMHCFMCCICRRQLDTGDEFFLIPRDGRLVCKPDYDAAKAKGKLRDILYKDESISRSRQRQ